MRKFLKKYVEDLHLEVRFVPLVNGALQVALIDNSYNLKGYTIIPKDAFQTTKKSEEEVLSEYLDLIVSDLGVRKAEIYSNRFITHKNQEFERFWRGE